VLVGVGTGPAVDSPCWPFLSWSYSSLFTGSDRTATERMKKREEEGGGGEKRGGEETYLQRLLVVL